MGPGRNGIGHFSENYFAPTRVDPLPCGAERLSEWLSDSRKPTRLGLNTMTILCVGSLSLCDSNSGTRTNMPSAEDADYRLDFIARPSHHGSIDVGEKRIPVNRTATTHIL